MYFKLLFAREWHQSTLTLGPFEDATEFSQGEKVPRYQEGRVGEQWAMTPLQLLFVAIFILKNLKFMERRKKYFENSKIKNNLR